MKFTSALIAVVGVAEAARYKSGAVTGFEKFTYGKFITRMKAPDKKGTVSSFFTYWNGPDFYPGGWNELDVEIVPSVSQNPFSMNVIYGDGHKKHETHDYQPSFDPKDDWHIYEMAWTPEFIAWSIDNKEVRRVEKDDPSIQKMAKGQSVMMNFWTPTFESWGKGFKAADMPWYVLYDYVETHTWNSETNGFDFHWRDDFQTFDSNRWHKSDNTTFDANSTTFHASQSYVKDGHLVLKMEPDAPVEWHRGLEHTPTSLEPVQGQPTYEHTGAKGQKMKKSDQHYDVLEEQHHSHDEHSHGGPATHERSPRDYYSARDPYAENPYYGGLYEHQQRQDPYAYGTSSPYDTEQYPYNPTHHTERSERSEGHFEEEMGAESAGAHLTYRSYHDTEHHDQHHLPEHKQDTKHHEVAKEEAHHPLGAHSPEHAPVHHEAPVHGGEVHASSEPAYYDSMFGGHMDGIPEFGDGHTRRHREAYEHRFAQEAHHPEVFVTGVQDNLSVKGAPEIGHLDETPYEYTHSDYEARYMEHDQVPHEEVVHGDHGLQDRILEKEDMPVLPSYEELLWSYQHGGFHQGDAEGEIHHEDVDEERDDDYYGDHHDTYYGHDELPLYTPHLAEHEYTMDHGEQHPTPQHYEHDHHQDFRTEDHQGDYHEGRHYENPEHHEGGAFWRGDHYDDQDKRDEDFRHDTTAHAYHPGDTYEHDVSHHGGTQMMHDIEHEYDQLFHEIEASTKHGVEHRDTYKTLPLDAHHGVEHTEVHEADKHHKTTHAEHAHAQAHRYEEKHAEAAHHSQDRQHHEATGPSMYAWATHDYVEPTTHHTIAERYHRQPYRYHDPVIHGDHGSSEYHELNHEPFHGDYKHGDLHFEPLDKSKPAQHHHEQRHEIAYPHHEAPHEAAHAPAHHDAPHKEATAPVHKQTVTPHHEAAKSAPTAKATTPAATPAKKAAAQPALAKKLLQ